MIGRWTCDLCGATGTVSGWGSESATRDAALAELERHYAREHKAANESQLETHGKTSSK